MKLESILGIIVLTVFVGGVVFYNTHREQVGSIRSDSSMVMKDEKALNKDHAFMSIGEKKAKFDLAPEISTPDGFINTDGKPITISEFKGKKVVLLDIWTYSCINCQRTIPYLNNWYKKYEDQGLVIIGLHTPEFSFERVQKNVEDAVKKYGIKYPVVLDNDFSTWNAYENSYWPRKYLIDIDGFVVYDHAGEGNYDVTEKAIQLALFERNARMGNGEVVSTATSTPKNVTTVESDKVGSPEIYFGSSRNQYLANGGAGVSGEQNLIIPQALKLNNLYLGGNWNMTSEFAENKGDASVVFKYRAKNVYLVGGSKDGVIVEVYKDGVLLKTIMVKNEQLYALIEGGSYGEHTLKMKIKGSGLQAFTFTFG